MKGTAVLLGNQTRPTHLRNIELLLRIRVPRVVLILEIERNILEIERSILQIGRNILIVTNPSLSTDPLPRVGHKIDLGHNPRAEMAHDTDHRVGTDNNVAIHHVTQRVPIILATHVTDLVPIRVVDRLATETILEAMMTSPPETEVALYTTKTGMETSITSSSKEINLLI